MKETLKLLSVILTILIWKVGYGQAEITNVDMTAANKYFNEVMDGNKIETVSSKRYSSATLNLLFQNQINAVSGSSKISTTPFYASISNDDDLFSIGGNFTFNASEFGHSRFILSGGLNANSAKSFASFYKNGKPESELNAKVSFTIVGNGTLKFYDTQKTEYLAYKNQIATEFEAKVNKLLEKSSEMNTKALRISNNELKKKATLKTFQEEVDKIIAQSVKDEVAAIEEYKWFNWARDWFVNVDCKLPLSSKTYQFSDSANASNLRDKKFYAWQFGVSGSMLWKHKSKTVINLTGKVKAYNNNNIETEDLSALTNNVLSSNTTSQITVVDTKKFYQGTIKEFVSYSAGGEFTIFPANTIIGLSLGSDLVFGDYECINWKIGLPVSLKDEDGKPTVNFELQWKEVSKNHFVGVNVGFTIDKLFKK